METTAAQSELSLNSDQVRRILVGFVRDGVHNTGLRRGIVGLSGGIDSTLSAFLAAEALGKENVLGVIMPFRESNPQSQADAEKVVNVLGIQSEIVDISPMVDAYLSRYADPGRVRSGNVMARQRMIVLYDLSIREKGLVIGTSNKTETLLGYTTLYGDNACAINPLGDLYKTQVWQLAAAIGVPGEIIEKTPSADLWKGQTDEGELGFTYREVDRLLYYMVDERRTDGELGQMGFPREFITSVQTIIRKTQFKRRPPIIAKISHRTVNLDFRYARDWGI
jgi:NAD+ synthase